MTTRVIATEYGDSSVLKVVEEPTPTPGPGEVLVSLRAAAVNPADWKFYNGQFGTDPSKLPLRLGFEGAGVVSAVGEGVTSVSVGDEVITYPATGTYATDIVVGEDALTPKPATLDWAQAAGLLLVGVTAVHALVATEVGEGDTILIHGGAGGVGQMAVQLAVLKGARVIATAAPRNHDLVRSLGAEPVAYGDGLLERVHALAPEGVDAALDLVGSDEAVEVSVGVVADRDRIASINAWVKGREAGIKLLGAGPGADPGDEIRAAARAELAALAAAGRLKVTVGGTFPLAAVAQAHESLRSGGTSGKIALLIG